MLFNHGVPKRAALHLQLPPPASSTHCCSLDGHLLFCTSCPLSTLAPERLQLMHIVSPFYCKGLTYPVPLRHSSICTCFGPQCPQKPTGCTGESYKTSEAGPVLSYEGDRPCFRKGSSCQLAFMFTDSLSTLNQLQPQTPGAFHSHPDISI